MPDAGCGAEPHVKFRRTNGRWPMPNIAGGRDAVAINKASSKYFSRLSVAHASLTRTPNENEVDCVCL